MRNTETIRKFSAVLLLFGLFIFWAPQLYCSKTEKAPPYTHRPFDPGAVEKFRNDPDFDYRRENIDLSLIERFANWLDNLFSFDPPDLDLRPPDLDLPDVRLPEPTKGAIFGKVLLWALVIGIVGFILYQILRVGLREAAGTSAGKFQGEEAGIQDILSYEVEDEIAAAVKEGKWRTAVRLLYLRVLKSLAHRDLISWQVQKTNHDYIRELRSQVLRSPFRETTKYFEYIWYGDFPVDREIFSRVRESFSTFEKLIQDQK